MLLEALLLLVTEALELWLDEALLLDVAELLDVEEPLDAAVLLAPVKRPVPPCSTSGSASPEQATHTPSEPTRKKT